MRDCGTTRQRGFTLIELLIVLGAIALLMTVGAPALLKMSNEIKLKNAARETVSGMRMARYRAINESRTFGFSATPAPAAAVLNDYLEEPGVLKIFEGNDPDAGLIREIPMAGGVYVVKSDFGTANDTFVLFNPDGSAGNAGDIVLKNGNEREITVTVGPASTARMTISKIEDAP